MIQPKAILFDWDQTLAHTREAVVEAIEYVLTKYHKEPWTITQAKYRDTTKSFKENFSNFFGADAQKAYQCYLNYYEKHCFSKVVPFKNADNFLMLCSKKGINLYIISNKEKSLLKKEVSFCFPNIFFQDILGNGDALHNKPAPDPVFTALDDTDYTINSENVWLVGDSKQDTECAYNAGIQPILLGKGNFMDDAYIQNKLHSNQPLFIFNNFAELAKFIETLTSPII